MRDAGCLMRNAGCALVAACLAGSLALATPVRPAAQVPPPSFDDWLAGVRTEAAARGVSERTLNEALNGLHPDPVIIARDRLQPEHTQSLDAYVASHVTKKTIARERTMARTHAAVLERVRQAYDVPPAVLLSI